MSSASPSPSETGDARASPGTPRGSLALALVMVAVLGALVWAVSPRQPRLTPAPLRPPLPDCPKTGREFIPTNITRLPDPLTDALPQSIKHRVLFRVNVEPCSCGCGQSVAACHVSYPTCETSARLAKAIVSEENGDTERPAKAN